MTPKDDKLSKGKIEVPEVIAWCNYCKDPIYEDNDYVKNNSSFYHVDCWKQEHNIVEELKFD